ncbi:NAD(P)-dependent oxidoreductase [Nitrospinaceae bacterium]|nr:NAD(P)-dependent oxidoreductase [Nitrospinaceae bacterium]
MKILITGDRGYIGSVLAQVLSEHSYDIVGFDTDYYRGTDLYSVERSYRKITRDIRSVSPEDVQGVEAVVHLAGLSNDPLGELAPNLTEDINLRGTLQLARLAREAGVKRFVYASSQSMYGISNTDDELDEDDSDKNPLTAYARTKWDAELQLKELANENFTIVCFRPSTVFGASPRLRCDIVFNNLVACAYTTGKIEIKSDGTPWRPVVHVRDVSSAFLAGLEAPKELVAGRSFNVGIPDGNYTVRDLAEAAQKAVPGSTLTFTGEHGSDSRTYKISFKRILSELKDYYKPEWNLERGGRELVALFEKTGFTEDQFRGLTCNRLMSLNHIAQSNQINKDLFWA